MRTMLCVSLVCGIWIAAAALCSAPAAAIASPAAESNNTADWPQWRGPTRDGIAPPGPKLADSWPKDGPPRLWKSEPIPGGANGGMGSIVVAGGRAFVFVHWIRPKSPDGKAILTAEMIEEIAKGPNAPTPEEMTALAAFKDKDFSGAVFEDELTARGQGVEGSKDTNLLTPAIVSALGPFGNSAAKRRVMMTMFEFRDTVVCLDAATGNTLWKKDFPGVNVERWGAAIHFGASSTPAVAGDYVYAQGSAGLYCLSVKDGDLKWQAATRMSNSSPLVANGVVYVASGVNDPRKGWEAEGGDLIAYDAESGKILWRQPDVQGAEGMSVVSWYDGGKQYLIGPEIRGLVCVDALSGRIVWREKGTGAGEGSSTVALTGNTAVFWGKEGLYAFALSAEKADQLWLVPVRYVRAGSVLAWGDNVYASSSDRTMWADLKTGQLKWEVEETSNGHEGQHQFTSPVLADGKILQPVGWSWFSIFMGMSKATPEGNVMLGKFPEMKGGRKGIVATCSSPALADGKLYLRLYDGVACYDLRADAR